MSFKNYIKAILVLIASIVVSQQSTVIRNQEVVVDFSSTQERCGEEDAIDSVKRQLRAAGATNIVVSNLDDGNYKISYYSCLDLKDVEQQIDLENHHSSDDNDIASDYKLDFYDLQSNNSLDSGLNDVILVESKQDFLRGTQDLPSFAVVSRVFRTQIQCYHVTLRTNQCVTLSIEEKSYKFPVVRAGPSIS